MKSVEAYYVGGPMDGRHTPIPTNRDGEPTTWLAVPDAAPPGRERRPISRLSVHRYERESAPAGAGMWRYHHRGSFA